MTASEELTLGLAIISLAVFVLGYEIGRIYENEAPPMKLSAKKSKIIWGLWHTGDRMYKDIISKGQHKQFKRILLMKPDSQAFHQSIAISGFPEQMVKDEILLLTKYACEKGIPVRWYKDFHGVGLTIYDSNEGDKPNSISAYLVYTPIEKEEAPWRRKHYKEKQGNSYFDSKLNLIDEIWNNDNLSELPNIEECKNAESKSNQETL